jgi:pimeloyl-ACP methyl ester carboxylesterase
MRNILLSGMTAAFLAGCSINPYGADTFTRSGVVSGSILEQNDCPVESGTAVWVSANGRGECVRYFTAGMSGERVSVALVHFHGDVMWQDTNGTPTVYDGYEDHAAPSALQALADKGAETANLPYIRLSRPGTFGSSGDHRLRRQPENLAIVEAALDAIKAKHGIDRVALAGQSGGGHLVGALLARRNDIACAAISSGVVSVRSRSHMHGWFGRDFTGFWHYVDPIATTHLVPENADRRIFVIGDPKDRNTPFATQAEYHYALRALGRESVLIEAQGDGPQHHGLAWTGIAVAADCAAGKPTDQIVEKYAAKNPT